MKGFLDYVVRRSKNYQFIVDQSYEHYTRSGVFVPKEVVDLSNLVLLHSMSKQYSIPGLRLGYVTACPAIIQRLRSIRQPWSVNALAIEAARCDACASSPTSAAEILAINAQLSIACVSSPILFSRP